MNMVWWYISGKDTYIFWGVCVWAMKVEKVEKEKDNGRKKKIEGYKIHFAASINGAIVTLYSKAT